MVSMYDYPKEYDVVSTNRLYPVKNLGVLLRAMAQVKTKRPDLRVAMGGSGSAGWPKGISSGRSTRWAARWRKISTRRGSSSDS